MAIKGSLFRSADLDGREAATVEKGLEGENQSLLLNATGLQVTFLSEYSGLKNILLPWPAKGNYYLDSTDELQLGKYIYIEEAEGRWIIHSTKPAFFRNAQEQILYRAELTHGSTYILQNAGDDYTVFAEFYNERSNVFHNYRVERFTDITIGRTSNNDIQYTNPLVSILHTTLRWEKREWTIRGDQGVYINNKWKKEAVLNPGDSVFIVGLRLNIGFGFVGINDENGRIKVSSKLRRLFPGDPGIYPEIPLLERAEEPLFNRLPRKREPLKAEPIIIEAPPMSLKNNGIPLILRMGGSMVIGTASMLAGHVTSMLSSVLFPVLSQKYSEKQRREYEEKRQLLYGKYLDDLELRISEEADREKTVLNKNYPMLSEILTFADKGTRLWERRKIDDDFLHIRVGCGSIPLIAQRVYPPRRFEMEEDNLLNRMYQIAEEPVTIQDAPIMTSLSEDFVCGVLGNKKLVSAFITRMIMRLVILHSYDDVKLVMLTKPGDIQGTRYVRYLPHIWNDQRDFRYLAASTSEASQISEYLQKELEEDLRKPRDLKDILKERPYYVIVATDKKLFDSMEILKDVMRADKCCGVSVITAFDELPKECMKVFHLHRSGNHSVVHLNQIELPDDAFQMDEYDVKAAERCMKKICNISLRAITQSYSLPKMITFLEMYGVGNVEQLNPIKRWGENNPLKSLAAPVGVATDGSLFMLDLHEKYQGPHGLIAGMTGSGKSEFIITLILSLAVNYSPHEVSFILIDYKGGGLARAFDDKSRNLRLPHLVGTITNLDGAAIQRSMKAIQSELLRRQRLFNEAKSRLNEGSMDIYEYQKLYRNKLVEKPLPHLFLISDEFAELKKQEPEFMDKLISTARIGRSLGVHLILATQKPSGVVNDQIWSNSKFRICLKVQDRGDSSEMLKRPEAAELKDTGRFYLQVGYNEFFALGQSAWCGADYERSDAVIVHKDETVQILDSVGQVICRAGFEKKKEKPMGKQLDAIVRYLSELSVQNDYSAEDLWCEPLPTKLSPDELSARLQGISVGQYAAEAGLIDDPENQRQLPLIYDFSKSENLLIVGEPGSGKTTIVQSMILSLVAKNSAKDINIYAIDFSSKMLRMFRKLPQIGEVFEEDDEACFKPLVDMLRSIVNERKQLFASLEVGSYEEACEIKKIPLILVFIDNFAGFINTKMGSGYQYELSSDLKNFSAYGVKFIITCSHLNEVSMKVRQEIGDRIVFQMRDKYEYGDALNCRCSYYPPQHPGRGLYCVEGRPLEFQAVMYWPELAGVKRSQKIKAFIENLLSQNRENVKARRVPALTEAGTYEEFMERIPMNRIPLGYTVQNPRAISLPLKQFSKLQLYFGNPESVVPVTENFLRALEREQMEITIVKRTENSCFGDKSENHVSGELLQHSELITSSTNDLVNLWRRLAQEIKERQEILIRYCRENNLDAAKKDIYKETFNYMRENCRPICILFEEFSEFCLYTDQASARVFTKLFELIRNYQIYIIGYFYPESRFYSGDAIYRSFADEETVLLFGGRLTLQSLCELPREYASIDQVGAYDRFLMRYRDKYYPLYMPYKESGAEDEEAVEPDDRDIFKV